MPGGYLRCSSRAKANLVVSSHDIFPHLLQALKKAGLFHVPYRGTMLGAALGGGRQMIKNPLQPGETMDDRLEKKVHKCYSRIVVEMRIRPALVGAVQEFIFQNDFDAVFRMARV